METGNGENAQQQNFMTTYCTHSYFCINLTLWLIFQAKNRNANTFNYAESECMNAITTRYTDEYT